MTREITVITPENVTITYEMAGLGSRALAQLLDLIVQGLMFLCLFVVFWLVFIGILSSRRDSPLISFIYDFSFAIIIISAFLIFVGYFIYFEGFKNGQTPGKRWTKLRVVREEGVPIDLSNAAVRNLIRLVEFALGFYIISIISIIFSPKYKRLGDYAAGTIVVKERVTAPSAPVAQKITRTAPPASSNEAELARKIGLLTKDELEAVRRFANRRSELAPHVQEHVAEQITKPVMARLGISQLPEKFSYANFLDAVYDRSVDERGAL